MSNFSLTTVADALNGVVAGTAAASKAVVLDASSKINAMDITALKIGGTSVTSSAAEINAIDGLGSTAIKVLQHTVTAGEATAETVSIAAGLTVAGFVCSILRAGKDVTNKAAIAGSTTNLVVATNSTDYVLTEDDIIQAIVWA